MITRIVTALIAVMLLAGCAVDDPVSGVTTHEVKFRVTGTCNTRVIVYQVNGALTVLEASGPWSKTLTLLEGSQLTLRASGTGAGPSTYIAANIFVDGRSVAAGAGTGDVSAETPTLYYEVNR